MSTRANIRFDTGNCDGQSEQSVCSVCDEEPNPAFGEKGDTICVDCFNDMTAD